MCSVISRITSKQWLLWWWLYLLSSFPFSSDFIFFDNVIYVCHKITITKIYVHIICQYGTIRWSSHHNLLLCINRQQCGRIMKRGRETKKSLFATAAAAIRFIQLFNIKYVKLVISGRTMNHTLYYEFGCHRTGLKLKKSKQAYWLLFCHSHFESFKSNYSLCTHFVIVIVNHVPKQICKHHFLLP